MATFPSFVPLRESTEQQLDDLTTDEAVNGSARARVFYSGVKRAFVAQYRLNPTDRGTLQTFYGANRDLPFQYLWVGDNQTYTCIFTAPLKITYRGALAIVECRMRQV